MGNDTIADNLTPKRNTFCKLSEVDFNGIARRVELLATNNNNLKVTDIACVTAAHYERELGRGSCDTS